ncbi:MAG: alpha-L-rhamnosidase C-terminal domain-containing protein [Parabacteroides sp.]
MEFLGTLNDIQKMEKKHVRKTGGRLLGLLMCLLVSAHYATGRDTPRRPWGLMTDLVEHTERTWQNGYASSVPVWQLDQAIEPLQYAAVRSQYPCFSWIVPGESDGVHQLRYRVIVADSWEEAEQGRGTVWDSGDVESDQSVSVRYAGEPLKPATNYFWRVRVVTNVEGESDWSEVKAFRTAETLSDYEAAFYPQVKTLESPCEIQRKEKGILLVDFGKDAFGQLLLTLDAAGCASDSLILHLGECLQEGRLLRDPGPSSVRYQRYALSLLPGVHTYRIKIRKDARNTGAAAIKMPDYVGEVLPFRYCEIEGYQAPLAPTAVMREAVHYLFHETASDFQCANDTLNRIWELCKYSIRATSFAGLYVDGDRERIPYEADAFINQLCHYGVDREYSLARRSHEYLLQHPTWPTEWILQSVVMAWNDYLYTGDVRSLQRNYETLKARSLLQLREKNGLISTTTGLQDEAFSRSIHFSGQIRDIVDWPHTGILGLGKKEGGEADGFVFTDYNVVTNAWHYEALTCMARIASALGRPEEAEEYQAEAVLFEKRFNRLFGHAASGFYTDGLRCDTEHASLHGNMFPLLFGLAPEKQTARIVAFLQSRGMACSVYGSQFLLDALYEAHEAEYALRLLTKTDERSWYNMIRVGSTISLEAWDNKYKPNQDWNHAWGAAPANLLPRRLMGVEPLTPGCGLIRIQPQVASLPWARATVPTIRGTVAVQVENTEDHYTLQVRIPANMEAEIYLPAPAGAYQATADGKEVRTTRVKGQPFLSFGRIGSGSHTFRLSYP